MSLEDRKKRADKPAHKKSRHNRYAMEQVSPIEIRSPSAPEGKRDTLRFSPDEKPPDTKSQRLRNKEDKKLNNAKLHSETLNGRHDKALDKLVSYKEKIKSKKRRLLQFDDDSPIREKAGKMENGLLSTSQILHTTRKAFESSENDDSAELIDKGVAAVESAVAIPAKVLRENRLHQNKQVKKDYRKEERLQRKEEKLDSKAIKAQSELEYQKAIQKNPEQRKRNPVSQASQKRKYKKAYAEEYRKSRSRERAAKKASEFTTKAASKIVNSAFTSKTIISVVLIVIVIVGALVACVSTASMVFLQIGSGLVASSYKAEDIDIHDADLLWTQLEMDLKERIDNIEEEYPDYDEYIYSLDEIGGHDPFELISFLTALYEDFTYEQVIDIIQQVFDDVYVLELEEEIEIRYREEIILDENGNEVLAEVPYEWKILYVTLIANDFTSVIMPRLQAYGLEGMYELYMATQGGHQAFGSPVPFEWQNSVTSLYGWRDNPTGEGRDFHRGLDISAPYGTSILAIHRGTVIVSTYHSMFGYYVAIRDDNGVVSQYAHCSSLLVSVGDKVDRGQVIARVGSTGNSTGNHLHLEIIDNGQYLNPIFLIQYTGREPE